jgi:hypothetical protein
MERVFNSLGTRLDLWAAAAVSLLLSYLTSVIGLVAALDLGGWDLAGGFVIAVAIPPLLGLCMVRLFQPFKSRHL